MSVWRIVFSLLVVAIASISLPACIDPNVKVLGNETLNLSPTNTVTPNTFNFKFALLNTAATVPNNLFVFLQGNENTSSAIINTCNLSGTACECVFQDSSGNQIGTTNSTTISYNTTGNYLRCQPSASIIGSVAKVFVQNIAGTVISSVLAVKSSLTAADLLGTLSASSLISVFNYYCYLYYLQKTGTSASSFDCSSNALSMLQVPFNFYLWGGTYSSTGNFGSKPTDILYNSGAGGTICGMQLNQEDCTVSTPAKAFGLYGTSTGIYTTPISLGNAPGGGTSLYGYAASTDTFTYNGTAYTECPPGLVGEVFYQASPQPTDYTDNNMPAGLTDTIVQSPSSTPTALAVKQYTGGTCGAVVTSTGTATSTSQLCTAPTIGPNTIHSYGYSSAGQTQFCVIPASVL